MLVRLIVIIALSWALPADAAYKWKSQSNLSFGALKAVSIRSIQSDTGAAYAVGTKMVTTKDTGDSWSIASGIGDYFGIDCKDRLVNWKKTGNCIAVGASGTVAWTNDSAVTWNKVQTSTSVSLNAIAWQNTSLSTIAVAVGAQGIILKTIDNGASWSTKVAANVDLSANVNLYAISNADNYFWAVGASCVIKKSSDQGDTWVEVGKCTYADTIYRAVHFISTTHGFVGGSSGSAASTVNGGATWMNCENIRFLDVRDPNEDWFVLHITGMTFISETKGWAVGQAETKVYTANGCRSWISQSYTYGSNLLGVSHDDHGGNVTVVAVGDDGTILRYDDKSGGAFNGSWINAASSESSNWKLPLLVVILQGILRSVFLEH